MALLRDTGRPGAAARGCTRWCSRDPYDEEVERFYLPIVGRGNRVLRVAGNVTSDPWRMVSAFFDRSMRREP